MKPVVYISHAIQTGCLKYFRLRRLPFIFFVTLALLAGCAAEQPLHQASSPYMDEHTRVLSQLTHWQLIGKIRLKTAESSDSANIQWQQNGDSYNLILSGPFGQTGARLEGSPYQVMLILPDKSPFLDSTPESLLYNHFGWDLPLSRLFYWVRTLPAPNSSYTSALNPEQQLARLQQDGWDIRYDRYTPQKTMEGDNTEGLEKDGKQPSTTQLPGRMKVKKGSLELTLIINQWQLLTP